MSENKEKNILNMIENEEDNNLLGRKRDKKSNEKTVKLMKFEEDGSQIIKNEITIKSENELSEYLSSLKNPYTIMEGKIIDLNTELRISFFYNDSDLANIYENNIDLDLLEDYKLIYGEYLKTEENTITVKYPMSFETFFIGVKFYLDLSNSQLPKLYKWKRNIHNGVNAFFSTTYFKIFHLFSRKYCGTTYYLMKQMSRNPEYKIYIDLKKLKEILHSKNKKENLEKFVFYSLFYIHNFYGNKIENSYSRVKKYFREICKRVLPTISSNNDNDFLNALLDAYVFIYKNYILKFLELEKYESNKSIAFILDHYENNFDIISKISQISSSNEKIKILVKYSLNNNANIEKLFYYIDNNDYKVQDFFSLEGIELAKDKILIGYYNEMIEFGKDNFDDKELEILKIYKDELIDNFGLNNPYYYIKFLDYSKNNNTQSIKDPLIIKKFIQVISNEIENNISKFYNYNLSDEYYFLYKYYRDFLSFPREYKNKEIINNIKRNIPLDYFILKYDENSRNIIEIKPTCNLVNRIITKKSQIFDCIIYQSKYYDNTNNIGEKGNILQRAIEEKIQIEPSILLNFLEKTYIFKVEYIIPSAKILNETKNDPVEQFYKEKIDLKRISTKIEAGNNKDITSYMSENEKKEMQELAKKLSSEKVPYNNVILIENNTRAKNYDMAIIKFIDNNFFILILIQITVSREKKKFGGVNIRFQKDLNYIIAKLEHFLQGYHSKSAHLIYILDKMNEKIIPDLNEINKLDYSIENKSNNEQENKNDKNINYKYKIPREYENNTHLLFFSRKFLNFFNYEGKMIKELVICDDGGIKFETSESLHYFSIDFLQKVFDKVLETFNIKVGKYYFNLYDNKNINGNYLIITKYSINDLIITININSQKLHVLKVMNNRIFNVGIEDNEMEEKISYFFEIINPNDVNKITIFDKIIIT